MPRYRTKPEQVDAILYEPRSQDFDPAALVELLEGVDARTDANGLVVPGADGNWLLITPGRWVVRHVDGVIEGLAPTQFHSTYEAVQT